MIKQIIDKMLSCFGNALDTNISLHLSLLGERERERSRERDLERERERDRERERNGTILR